MISGMQRHHWPVGDSIRVGSGGRLLSSPTDRSGVPCGITMTRRTDAPPASATRPMPRADGFFGNAHQSGRGEDGFRHGMVE